MVKLIFLVLCASMHVAAVKITVLSKRGETTNGNTLHQTDEDDQFSSDGESLPLIYLEDTQLNAPGVNNVESDSSDPSFNDKSSPETESPRAGDESCDLQFNNKEQQVVEQIRPKAENETQSSSTKDIQKAENKTHVLQSTIKAQVQLVSSANKSSVPTNKANDEPSTGQIFDLFGKIIVGHHKQQKDSAPPKKMVNKNGNFKATSDKPKTELERFFAKLDAALENNHLANQKRLASRKSENQGDLKTMSFKGASKRSNSGFRIEKSRSTSIEASASRSSAVIDFNKKLPFVNVVFMCLANTCRSPMAHHYFQAKMVSMGLESKVRVESCGAFAGRGSDASIGGISTFQLLVQEAAQAKNESEKNLFEKALEGLKKHKSKSVSDLKNLFLTQKENTYLLALSKDALDIADNDYYRKERAFVANHKSRQMLTSVGTVEGGPSGGDVYDPCGAWGVEPYQTAWKQMRPYLDNLAELVKAQVSDS